MAKVFNVGQQVDGDLITSLELQLQHKTLVRNLLKKFKTEEDDLMHAAIGISGEAGELLDAVKKHWAYNKPLDITNVVEELGDIEFYMQAVRQLLDLDRDDILQMNIAKLSTRYYKGKYSDSQAQERADKVESIPQMVGTLAALNSLVPHSNEQREIREYHQRNDDIERNSV